VLESFGGSTNKHHPASIETSLKLIAAIHCSRNNFQHTTVDCTLSVLHYFLDLRFFLLFFALSCAKLTDEKTSVPEKDSIPFHEKVIKFLTKSAIDHFENNRPDQPILSARAHAFSALSSSKSLKNFSLREFGSVSQSLDSKSSDYDLVAISDPDHLTKSQMVATLSSLSAVRMERFCSLTWSIRAHPSHHIAILSMSHHNTLHIASHEHHT
jgi:hypothetical protein